MNTRDYVDANVLGFQDSPWSPTEVDVLGTDGNLWKEFRSMTKRNRIDGAVRSLQDFFEGEIIVLAIDGNLWHEYGDMHSRFQIDGSATAFQSLDVLVTYVLGADGKLWQELLTNTVRSLVDQNVASDRVMTSPGVVVIYWGHDYLTNPPSRQQRANSLMTL